MALTPGTRLGPYEVLSALGAGAMGEVYRAHDTKLNRDVALKILPTAFASDPDRLARFTREAQTLASLNHPHIAHIHGLEDAGGMRALVLELVEGEDLSQRIARGPIPLDEVLPIARQIAEALEAAHEQSIIHRDLKPANIKVRADGAVKVLDFGLAKALDPLLSASSATLANSPTVTSPAAMTAAGIVLGTAAYMSPEQARGKVVDKRTDLWAFGCVLYEMLTGMRPFGGDDVTDTIAAVIRGDPDWSKLRSDTPGAIRRLLRRCLEKDRMRRLPDAADARLPDSKWVAYQSDESGRNEIYLQPFPGPGERIPLSAGGGTDVRWGRQTAEVFYLAADRRLTAVPVHIAANGALSLDSPKPLFHVSAIQALGLAYTVSADGQRFLLNNQTAEPPSIKMILNWKGKP